MVNYKVKESKKRPHYVINIQVVKTSLFHVFQNSYWKLRIDILLVTKDLKMDRKWSLTLSF